MKLLRTEPKSFVPTFGKYLAMFSEFLRSSLEVGIFFAILFLLFFSRRSTVLWGAFCETVFLFSEYPKK